MKPSPLGEAVARTLFQEPRALAPWMLYDARGSALFERICAQPEYHPYRAEREILILFGEDIVQRASADGAPLAVAELGAGTGTKTQWLLKALVARQGRGRYLACDIDRAPLLQARIRLALELPEVEMATFVGPHEAAGQAIAALAERPLVALLGSSLGNYPDPQAAELLGVVVRELPAGAMVLVGLDMCLDPARQERAYNDAAGVTAAFIANVLLRLNRELGATFDPAGFEHVARFDPENTRVDIWLESRTRQTVAFQALDRALELHAGERIHVESCQKYTPAHAETLLGSAGLALVERFWDLEGMFALHLARPRRGGAIADS